MILAQEQLRAILAAGGGLVVDATAITLVQLRALCQAAASGGGRLTVRRCSGLGAAQLKGLAALAPGRVDFDLSS